MTCSRVCRCKSALWIAVGCVYAELQLNLYQNLCVCVYVWIAVNCVSATVFYKLQWNVCVLFCFVNCNEMFVCYIVLWTALKCECIVVNYADALMCYGSVLFTCSSVRKLAYFHWVACVCVYVTLAMCSQTCKVMHHVLLLMQGRCCSFTNPVSRVAWGHFNRLPLIFILC